MLKNLFVITFFEAESLFKWNSGCNLIGSLV